MTSHSSSTSSAVARQPQQLCWRPWCTSRCRLRGTWDQWCRLCMRSGRDQRLLAIVGAEVERREPRRCLGLSGRCFLTATAFSSSSANVQKLASLPPVALQCAGDNDCRLVEGTQHQPTRGKKVSQPNQFCRTSSAKARHRKMCLIDAVC